MTMQASFVSAAIAAAVLLSAGVTTEVQAQAPAAAAKGARSAEQIPVGEILDDPKKLAVLKKHASDLAANPQIEQARGMSLAELAGYEQAGLTADIVKAIVAEINKL